MPSGSPVKVSVWTAANRSPMSDDYELWEQRYSMPGRKRKLPDAFLLENLERLQGPRLLDVAMGEGRNAIYLAQHGFQVVGVDRSPRAVVKAQQWGAELGLKFEALVVDLEREELPPGLFDSVVVTRYWQEDLCLRLQAALRPGGILLYETYTVEYLKYGPRNRSHLLAPGQLRQAFAGMEVLLYEEVDKPATREYSARLLARKPGAFEPFG